MKKIIILASTLALLCASTLRAPAQGATAGIVAAAKKFLATLNDEQRGKVVFDYKDQRHPKRGSNLPVNSVPRAGLRMGDLSKEQRDAAMALLAATLSKDGYQKVLQIVEGDEMLKAGDGGGGG